MTEDEMAGELDGRDSMDMILGEKKIYIYIYTHTHTHIYIYIYINRAV